MQVVVNSLLTTYERHGQGKRPALLVLHGWGDDSRGWREFSKRFTDDFDVYAVNLPGFGGTDMPPAAWGLDDYAAFVAAFLAKIDVAPFAIVAHSNGGAIAIRGLAAGVLSADKLVLLASAGVRSQSKGRKQALRLLAKAGKALAAPLPGGVRQRLRRKLYTAVGSDMLVAEHLQETFKKVVSDDVQADAARLSLPVLLVYGEQDVSTPPDFGRLLHELIDGSTLEILGEAGHFVHNDQPDRVRKLVGDFLK
jgi:pimeloyl-ACP methyl ester carboxylesterase